MMRATLQQTLIPIAACGLTACAWLRTEPPEPLPEPLRPPDPFPRGTGQGARQTPLEIEL